MGRAFGSPKAFFSILAFSYLVSDAFSLFSFILFHFILFHFLSFYIILFLFILSNRSPRKKGKILSVWNRKPGYLVSKVPDSYFRESTQIKIILCLRCLIYDQSPVWYYIFRADLILWIDPRQFSPTGVSLWGSFFPMLLGCHFYFYSYLKARCRITLHLNPQPMCPNTAPFHQKEANNVNPGCRTTFSGPTTWFNSVYP